MEKKIIFQKCHFNNIYFLFYIIITFLDFLIGFNIFPNENELSKMNEKESIVFLQLFPHSHPFFLS